MSASLVRPQGAADEVFFTRISGFLREAANCLAPYGSVYSRGYREAVSPLRCSVVAAIG